MKKIIVLLISCLAISGFQCSYAFSASESLSGIKVSKKSKSTKKTEETTEEKEKKEKKQPINESEYEPVLIGALLENPENYINKKIKFRGRFSSFTTLALDYEPAMRKSKDYISICLFRADSKIPLSELKLAYPVKDAKEDEVVRDLEEFDLLEIYGTAFSAALDEPWVDIVSMKKLESAPKKSGDKKTADKQGNDEKKPDESIKKNK